MNSAREQLLGYLLNLLSEEEQLAVETELERQPELRDQLALLASSLAPLGVPANDEPFELDGPPRGLAERTLDFLEETEQALSIASKPGKLSPVTAAEVASDARRFTWADCMVAATILLAAGAMLFPAVANSRRAAQITACQNNLRELGLGMQQFAQISADQRIPAVPIRGNRSVAGIYSAILKDADLLEHDSLVLCPSAARMNTESQAPAAPLVIPTLAEIDRAVGDTLVKIQRSLGGNYAYSLGFVEQGKHRAASMPGRTHYAVMSDAPKADYQPAKLQTSHHGRGQNMLYEDNCVKFVVNLDPDLLDDPFYNRSGMIAAGEDRDDIVLGQSFARPMPALFQASQIEMQP